MADLLPIAEVAAECDVSVKHAYRMVAKGVFSDLIGRFPDGSLGVERSAVERHLGRLIEPKPRAVRGRPPQTNPTPETDPLEAALVSAFALADLIAICVSVSEYRDRRWQGHLIAKGIDVDRPPLDPELAVANLKAQRFFTQSQAYELVTRAAKQRDEDWWIWATDPVARAQLPKGPGPFDFRDLDPNK